MVLLKNIFDKHIFALYALIVSLLAGCNPSTAPDESEDEDTEAKQTLQGTWQTELEGDVVFTIKGDTLYYSDSLSAPAAFCVRHDSLVIRNHKEVAYAIKQLNSTQFHFVNADGDIVELVKASADVAPLSKGEYKGAISLNQNQKIKRDTIVYCKDKRLHAYTQVNPTTYKVYRQHTNDDGLTVESVYYDNLVYIALYDGQHKVFGQNVMKKEFAGIVPAAYLEQAILSDIFVQGEVAGSVRFVAVLSIPDSYTNYRVNIDVTPDGRKKLSV